MLALEARRSTGRGQLVDMALYDGIARFLDEAIPVTAATGGRGHVWRSRRIARYRTTTTSPPTAVG